MKDEASYIGESCEEKQIVLQNAPALEGKPAKWKEADLPGYATMNTSDYFSKTVCPYTFSSQPRTFLSPALFHRNYSHGETEALGERTPLEGSGAPRSGGAPSL